MSKRWLVFYIVCFLAVVSVGIAIVAQSWLTLICAIVSVACVPTTHRALQQRDRIDAYRKELEAVACIPDPILRLDELNRLERTAPWKR